jgi:hypothetical protein
MPVKALLIALLLAGNATAEAQDLGQAAAREKDRQRRAKAAPPAKTYTEEDLQAAAEKRAREGDQSLGTDPQTATPVPVPAREASGPVDAPDPQAAKKARGAEYKARLDAINAQLEAAEKALAAAEKDWDLVETHPWTLAGAEPRVKERLEAARKRVQRLRAQRDEIEEAARREAIPPGYLR